MATLARFLWLLPLLSLLAVFPRPALGDPMAAPARTVEGVATTASRWRMGRCICSACRPARPT